MCFHGDFPLFKNKKNVNLAQVEPGASNSKPIIFMTGSVNFQTQTDF